MGWRHLLEYCKLVKPYTKSIRLELFEWGQEGTVQIVFISQAVWEEFGHRAPWVGVPELTWDNTKGIRVVWNFMFNGGAMREVREAFEVVGCMS